MALLQTLNRKVHRAFNRVRELNFSINGLEGFDWHGKTAGVVGTGKIGRVVAEILRGFGMKVVAYDPFPNAEWAARHGIEYVTAAALAACGDRVAVGVQRNGRRHSHETMLADRFSTLANTAGQYPPRCNRCATSQLRTSEATSAGREVYPCSSD